MVNSILETISELINTTQWLEAFPIMKQLRTDLTEETYIELLQDMSKDGYKLYAMSVEDKIVALVGLSCVIFLFMI